MCWTTPWSSGTPPRRHAASTRRRTPGPTEHAFMSEHAEAQMEKATVGRITARLMPLFCLMYLIAYIDRQNVSYAKLEMVKALGLSEAAYGLGASLFFIGYFLFEA